MNATGTPAEPPKQTIYVRNTPVAYADIGDGPAVLLLHGLGGTSGDWNSVLAVLARRHRVVAVDLPGYGASGPIPDSSPAGMANFLWDVADAVGLERCALMGHSEGGGVAIEMAFAEPARVPRVVLVSASGMGRGIHPAFVLMGATPLGAAFPYLAKLPGGPEALVLGLALAGSPRPWRIPKSWATKMRQAASSTGVLTAALATVRQAVSLRGQECLLLDRLPELTMPALVVWGKQDTLLPAYQARRATDRLRRGQLALIPLAGHLLPIEAPNALLAVAGPFLREDRARESSPAPAGSGTGAQTRDRTP
ncbi:alpha/beta fold hydrolase [Streptomyces chrestomyceticus]|uniref:alpha/beta fold hydrolase n=1 Tax=Streptomyces chrestomyceticus TaxID=68185 RepID=UPI0036C011C5